MSTAHVDLERANSLVSQLVELRNGLTGTRVAGDRNALRMVARDLDATLIGLYDDHEAADGVMKESARTELLEALRQRVACSHVTDWIKRAEAAAKVARGRFDCQGGRRRGRQGRELGAAPHVGGGPAGGGECRRPRRAQAHAVGLSVEVARRGESRMAL